MLLSGISLNAALPFLVSASAIPLNSGTLSLVSISNADLSSSLFNSTGPIPNSNPSQPAYTVMCLETRAGLDLTAVKKDCSSVLNDELLRLEGVFEKRAFFQNSYRNSAGHWVFATWSFHQCTIYVKSAQTTSLDHFTLFEVALTANKILSECVTNDRKGQGGLMSVGSRGKGFYVGLQGSLPGVNINPSNVTDVKASSSFEPSQLSLDAKGTTRGLTSLQPRILDSSGGSVTLNETLSPSNATRPKGTIDHDIDCFPRGSQLPNVNADDCKFVINSIILGMKDPLRAQTWGYTDTVDINLSLPEYRWAFGRCKIRVKNIDEEQVDRFRPVDVADLAQRMVQKCVIETKEPLGGNADIGQLEIPGNFYVVVSGIGMRGGESLGNDTTLALPSGSVGPDEIYPANCFDRSTTTRLKPAIASDCDFIINDMILRLPNPMMERTFGYTDAVDINLSIKGNSRWIYEQCVVFIGNTEQTTSRDRFRYVDVAYTAHRIIERCVKGSKYGIGGTADIGTLEGNFYVAVAGVSPSNAENGTSLGLVSITAVSSASSKLSVLSLRNRTESTLSHDSSLSEFAELE